MQKAFQKFEKLKHLKVAESLSEIRKVSALQNAIAIQKRASG